MCSAIIEQARERARETLRGCITPHGFRASALAAGYPQIWARDSRQAPVFVTINTPAAASPDKQCGRVAHLDTHVTAGEMPTRPQARTLAECPRTLSKAEHVLAFMLFDLAACIQEDTRPPEPPPIQ